MIYLNLLNRIFGPKRPLTRDEIDALNSGNSSHQTEMKAEDEGFNSEAIDGWAEVEGDVDRSMKEVDQKMNYFFNELKEPKSGARSVYLFIGLFTAVMLMLIIYTYEGNQLFKNSLAENKKTTIESEVSKTKSKKANIIGNKIQIQIKEIDSYTPINKSKQITKEQLIRQETLAASKPETVNENIENQININKLKPKTTKEVPTSDASNLSYTKAYEVYLHGLKTIDYRSMRSEKKIKLLQELPMGTPANQANKEELNTSGVDIIEKEVDYIDYIKETQRLFSRESFKTALRRYLIILEHYPNDVNAHFYSGLCYHNVGQYDIAIEHFDKSYSLQIGNFREEARWFKVKALLGSGDEEKAKKIIKEIQKEGGFYSEQATELLNSL